MSELIDGTTGLPVVELRIARPTLPVAGKFEAEARALVIEDQDSYDFADQQLARLQGAAKEFEAQRKTIVDPINTAKNAVQALFMPVINDLETAIAVVKGGMLAHRRKQQLADAERQAAADKAAREERERLEKLAAKAGKKDPEKAEVLRQTAAIVTAPVATSTFAQAKGVAVRKIWKARVTDKLAVIKFVAEHPDYAYLLDVNATQANNIAKMQQANLAVAGLEAYEEEQLAKRAVRDTEDVF